MRKKVVVLTGAGISAESGISTFRDSGGLWEGHDIMEVASPEGWHANPELVQNFYNLRRKNVLEVTPNEGHKALVKLEEKYEVQIITQNVDDLHERAGSKNVLHLHGELLKVRSIANENTVLDWTGDLAMGDCCEHGHQLRPHIVWFGEQVPAMEEAALYATVADYFLVIGTSLVVYPAAGLLDMVSSDVYKYLIDPNIPEVSAKQNVKLVAEKASTGVPKVVDELLSLD